MEKDQFDWQLPLEDYGRFPRRAEAGETAAGASAAPRWGGWARRALAFSIDLAMVAAFSALLVYLTYVAYSVGLAANRRTLSLHNAAPFWRLSLWGCFFLGAWYFILFHAVAGKTIGKWLLGLRVVGQNCAPITYRQAVKRCIGYLISAVFGLGFLWILVSRERRGWHDHIAGTWVIRDRAGGRTA
ncbi:MAG TPA: RDD family protein [Candidatus Acidoferrales bacterium]|nr:RDD family protein [Candidatus Acidoferrales bacterium]